MFGLTKKVTEVTKDTAITGRDAPIVTTGVHHVFGNDIFMPVPAGAEQAVFGMGCFWGVERMFWKIPGVITTMVGYAAGYTENATYEEVCSGQTGHNEVVRVIFDPSVVSYEALLKVFWEGHDPTQGMRQGNDRGTQYRSGIYTFSDAQAETARASKAAFGPVLLGAGHGAITTEIEPSGPFYYAELYHQQYLSKNPAGYCGIGGTGAVCPIGLPTP